MEPLPPVGTRICNAFNGETFIFTHVDEGAREFQCDIFIEVVGMKTGTGRQHLHPDADEEFIVKDGKLKLPDSSTDLLQLLGEATRTTTYRRNCFPFRITQRSRQCR